MASDPKTLAAAHRQYDRNRAARGLPPLDRTPIDPNPYCTGCPWTEARCVRPEGPCSFNPAGPNSECLHRYGGGTKRCPMFRRGCRMRVCDCPYWPIDTFQCQHCGQDVPHQAIVFAQTSHLGLTEAKKRSYGFDRPSSILCRACFDNLRLTSNTDIQFLADTLAPNWAPGKTEEERKAAKREYMREYMRQRRAE